MNNTQDINNIPNNNSHGVIHNLGRDQRPRTRTHDRTPNEITRPILPPPPPVLPNAAPRIDNNGLSLN
jgi:hypothetical protein